MQNKLSTKKVSKPVFIFSPQEYLAACGEDELRLRKNNPALSGHKTMFKNRVKAAGEYMKIWNYNDHRDSRWGGVFFKDTVPLCGAVIHYLLKKPTAFG